MVIAWTILLCVFVLLFYAWLFFFCVKRLKKSHQGENRKLLNENFKYKKSYDAYLKKNHEELNKLMKGIDDEIQRLYK